MRLKIFLTFDYYFIYLSSIWINNFQTLNKFKIEGCGYIINILTWRGIKITEDAASLICFLLYAVDVPTYVLFWRSKVFWIKKINDDNDTKRTGRNKLQAFEKC
jgi:hypothetical protein